MRYLVLVLLLSGCVSNPVVDAPKTQEIVMDKIKAFEESIPTIWLPEQLEQQKQEEEELEKALA